MKKTTLPVLLVAIVAGLTLVASAFAAAPGNTTDPTVTGYRQGRGDAERLERHLDR